MCTWDCCSILAAILLPPLGVFMKRGCSCSFLLCILLTLLGYIPGLVYAVFIVVSHINGHGHEHEYHT